MGWVPGAAISGGGEVLAQLIENNGNPTKLNLKRVALEAGLGAIPGSKLLKLGSPLKSALLGATAAGVGVAGRKITADDPEERKINPLSDLLQIGIGGAAGGVVGKLADRAAEKASSIPGILEKTLKTQHVDETPRLIKPQEGLRVGSVEPVAAGYADQIKAGDVAPSAASAGATPIFAGSEQAAHRTHDPAPPVVRETDQKVSRHGFDPREKPAAPSLPKISEVDRTIDAAANVGKAQRVVNDKGDKAFQKRIVAKERAAGQADALKNKEGRTVAKAEQNAYSMLEKESAEEAAARRIAEIKGDATEQTISAKDSFKAKGVDGGTESATITHNVPSEAGPAARPLSGRPSSLESSGKAVMTPERAQQLIGQDPEAAVKRGVLVKEGDGYRINVEKKTRATTPAGGALPEKPVSPKPGIFQIVKTDGKILEAQDEASALAIVNALGPGKSTVIPPSDLAPRTPKPKAVKGTANEVLEKQEAAAPIAEKVPEAVPAVPPPQAIKPTTGATGPKLSVPLAMDVAQTEAEIPAGSTIARFFRTPDAALKSAAYNEEVPDNAIGTLNSLIGRAEVTPKAPTGKRKPPSALWTMVSKMQNELDLPQFPRGSKVKPSFKHVPENMRPGPSASVPVVDVPAAPKAKAPSGKAAKVPTVDATIPSILTQEGTPGMTITPAAPVADVPTNPHVPSVPRTLEESDALGRLRGANPSGPGQPIPPELQMRMDTLKNKMMILENSGRGNSPEAEKLAQEAEKMQLELFATQYPDLMVELANAERASKTPKPKGRATKKPKPSSETGQVELGGLVKFGLPLAGAAIGGATDDEDPLRGAAIGAGLGYGGAKGIEALSASGKPLIHIDPDDPKGSIVRMLSGLQRFNFLTDPAGLSINTFLAPVGAGVMGGLERAAVGKAEQITGADPMAGEKVQQGIDSLRELLSSRGALGKESWDNAWSQADSLIGSAERAEELPQETLSQLQALFALPGRAMTTGDVVVRNALQAAGIPEDIARAITVTSNPRYDIGEAIVNFAKNPTGSLLLPFSRTAANILEGGLERTPFVGLMLNKTNDPEIKATFTEMATRQGLGAGMWYLGYLAGKNVDPEAAKTSQLRKIITNMSGQYALPVGAGFAAGQAVQLGKIDGGLPSLIAEGIKSTGQNVPLPATKNLEDVANLVPALMNRQPIHPEAEGWVHQHLPYSLTPGLAPVAEDLFRHPENVKLPWE